MQSRNNWWKKFNIVLNANSCLYEAFLWLSIFHSSKRFCSWAEDRGVSSGCGYAQRAGGGMAGEHDSCCSLLCEITGHRLRQTVRIKLAQSLRRIHIALTFGGKCLNAFDHRPNYNQTRPDYSTAVLTTLLLWRRRAASWRSGRASAEFVTHTSSWHTISSWITLLTVWTFSVCGSVRMEWRLIQTSLTLPFLPLRNVLPVTLTWVRWFCWQQYHSFRPF